MTPQDPRAAPVRRLLTTHVPGDEREAAALATTLDALDRLPRPFDKEADAVHLTASGIVVGPRGLLLHRHKRLGRWMQPGGHVDPGETPEEAALRETLEETGVPATHPTGGPALLHLDVHEVAYGHTHLDLRYALHAGDVDPAPGDGESPDVAWFTPTQAEALADAGLAGALAALRRRDSPH